MPHVQFENYALSTSNNKLNGIWKLSRAMKAAGWRYKASSDATAKDNGGNPSNDKWGPGVQVGAQTGTVSMTITAATTTSAGGRSTVSGMTGANFASTSVGNFLTITGATNAANNGTFVITAFVSATSVTVENPAAISETTGAGATWKEVTATTDTFPTLGVGSWWCAQGPSTIKVPIGTAVPGNFIRGENVTQSTSGAEGELLGVLMDTVNGGYLVISPRVSGTGAGPRGWDSSHVITGAFSGATATATGTPIEFVREIIFWVNTSTTGHIYYQCIDSVGEASTTSTTGRFSVMAAAIGGADFTHCPGAAAGNDPTTNGFPTKGTMVAGVGTAGPGAVTTGSTDLFNNSNAINAGKVQILVANAIENSGVSADGSITLAGGVPGAGTTQFEGWGFQRLDDAEGGDVDPYVWCVPNTVTTGYTRTRLGGGTVCSVADSFAGSNLILTASTMCLGFRKRGFTVGDTFQEFGAVTLGFYNGAACSSTNGASPDRVASNPTTVTVRDPIWVFSGPANNPTSKCRKGTLRWWFLVQGNASCDTYDTKRWIQLSSTSPAVVVGPGDQTTTPTNQ